jgi:hypothetical protein
LGAVVSTGASAAKPVDRAGPSADPSRAPNLSLKLKRPTRLRRGADLRQPRGLRDIPRLCTKRAQAGFCHESPPRSILAMPSGPRGWSGPDACRRELTPRVGPLLDRAEIRPDIGASMSASLASELRNRVRHQRATGKAQEVRRLLPVAVPKGQQAAGMFVSVILTLAIRATVPRRRRPH